MKLTLFLAFLILTTPAVAHADGARLVSIAQHHLGTNPTGWRRLWCGKYLALVLRKAGYKPPRNEASSLAYLKIGHQVPARHARPGDIVVTRRRGGGHVGIFVKWVRGRMQLISGNAGRRPGKVRYGTYSLGRVVGVRRL